MTHHVSIIILKLALCLQITCFRGLFMSNYYLHRSIYYMTQGRTIADLNQNHVERNSELCSSSITLAWNR